MALVIGFLTDGVLIAAAGESTAAALGELVDHLGPDAELAYAKGRESLEAHLQGTEPPRGGATGAGPLDALADALSRQSDRGGGGEGASVARPQDETSVEAPAEAEAADESGGQGVQPGGPEESLDAADHGAGEPCVVCDRSVPTVLAQISVTRFGDVRCRSCGDW